jgi:hypothetical protein
MKKLLYIVIILIAFTHCDDDDMQCTIHATVKDLTGLDGCGFVFELEDGSRIEPIRPSLFCGTPPLPKEITENPLYGFEFIDGKRVKISFEETGSPSICMVGLVVKVTCIEEIVGPAGD